MAHRTIDLPFSNAELHFTGGRLWAAPPVGAQLFGFDPVTLSVEARLTSQSRMFFVAHGLLVGDVGYGEVSAIDAQTGAPSWKRRGYVRGATASGFLVSTSQTLELVTPNGESSLIARDDSSRLPLPCILAEGLVWTVVGRELIGMAIEGQPERMTSIALGAGTVLPIAIPREHDGHRLSIIERLEDRRGPRARLSALEGPSLEFVCEVEGEVRSAVATPDMVMFTLLEEGRRVIVRGEERVEISDARGACTSHGALATLQHGALVVVTPAPGGSGLVVSRAALPTETRGGIASSGAHLYATSGSRLFIIDPRALEPGDQAMSYARIVDAASADPEPAQVVFAGGALVAVNHPRLGRLSLDRTLSATPLAKGDAVILDDVKEAMPGLWKVSAWHKVGEEQAPTSAAAKLEVGVAEMPPLFREAVKEHRTFGPVLEAALGRHRLSLDGKLRRLVSLHDTDPTFARWLDRISMILDITGLSITQVEGTDPCLLGIAANGNGDAISLYLYPPAIEAGIAPPVVDFWHETREITYLAADFDSYLEEELRSHAEDEIGKLILEKLGPLGKKRPTAEPPEWFIAVHGEGPLPDRKEVAKLKKTDPRRAERMLVRLLREDPEDTKVAKELAALYKTLGWSWHRENLLSNQD